MKIGLNPVILFVPFGCSSRLTLNLITGLEDLFKSFPPFHTRFTAQKNSSPPKRRTAVFCAVSFLTFTHSFLLLGGATAAIIPLHSVSLHSSSIPSLTPVFSAGTSSPPTSDLEPFLFLTIQL